MPVTAHAALACGTVKEEQCGLVCTVLGVQRSEAPTTNQQYIVQLKPTVRDLWVYGLSDSVFTLESCASLHSVIFATTGMASINRGTHRNLRMATLVEGPKLGHTAVQARLTHSSP